MTGYGRGEALVETPAGSWRVEVELSSVNRRQLDVAAHLPGALSDLEGEVRKRLGDRISRGRVQVRTTVSSEGAAGPSRVRFDAAAAMQVLTSLRSFCSAHVIPDTIGSADLLRAPGVFSTEEPDYGADGLREGLLEAVGAALAGLLAMQEAEGAHLRVDLETRLAAVAGMADRIRAAAPQVVENHRRHLKQRLEEAGLELDLGDERLLREIGLFAERCDISEELTRLASHLEQFHAYLAGGEPPGRPLDFLCQELQREVNTIGSKGSDAGIARLVVAAKTEVEKIREQVQNLQ